MLLLSELEDGLLLLIDSPKKSELKVEFSNSSVEVLHIYGSREIR